MKFFIQISIIIFILLGLACTEEWKIQKNTGPLIKSNGNLGNLSGSSQKHDRISGTNNKPSIHLSGSAPPLNGSLHPPSVSGG